MKLDNAINLDRKSGGRGAPVQTFNARRDQVRAFKPLRSPLRKRDDGNLGRAAEAEGQEHCADPSIDVEL
jgi:hypothetical protein